MRHFQRKHPVEFEKAKTDSKQQPSVSDMFKSGNFGTTFYQPKDQKKKDLDKVLMFMLAKDFKPLRETEKIGFRAFCKKMNPKYKLPSRSLISKKLLPAFYDEQEQKLRKILDSVPACAITTDMWSSRNKDS